MKDVKYFLLFIIILLCMLASCDKVDYELKKKICSPDKNITEIVSKKYTDVQLLAITKLEGSIKEIDKKYPVECLREIGMTYRAAYLGNDSIAIIHFDNKGNKTFGKVYGLYSTKVDFNELAIGQPLEIVKSIDSQGEYLFLETGRNDIPRRSTHYTKDGYLIIIKYDESNTVEGIHEELI